MKLGFKLQSNVVLGIHYSGRRSNEQSRKIWIRVVNTNQNEKGAALASRNEHTFKSLREAHLTEVLERWRTTTYRLPTEVINTDGVCVTLLSQESRALVYDCERTRQ